MKVKISGVFGFFFSKKCHFFLNIKMSISFQKVEKIFTTKKVVVKVSFRL